MLTKMIQTDFATKDGAVIDVSVAIYDDGSAEVALLLGGTILVVANFKTVQRGGAPQLEVVLTPLNLDIVSRVNRVLSEGV